MIGISLGFLPKLGYSFKEALALASAHNITAIEIPAIFLKEETPPSISNFDWVSIHAESFPHEKTLEAQINLNDLLSVHRIRPLDLVVFHPDQITNFKQFASLPFSIAFENSDQYKATFQRPEEFKKIFNISKKFKLVLDVNHAYANDPTLSIAQSFYRNFKDRLAEIHLSGYRIRHDPLFRTQQIKIIQAIQRPAPPIILEGIGASDEIELELSFVKSFFR